MQQPCRLCIQRWRLGGLPWNWTASPMRRLWEFWRDRPFETAVITSPSIGWWDKWRQFTLQFTTYDIGKWNTLKHMDSCRIFPAKPLKQLFCSMNHADVGTLEDLCLNPRAVGNHGPRPCSALWCRGARVGAINKAIAGDTFLLGWGVGLEDDGRFNINCQNDRKLSGWWFGEHFY